MTKVTLHKVRRKHPRGGLRQVWMLRWYGTDGKRYGETIGDSRQVSKRDAEAARREKQSKLDCNVEKPDKPRRMTLAAFMDHDRAAIADRRHKTLLEHDHAAAHPKRVIGADTRLDRIGRAHVVRLRADMQKSDYRPATIDKTLRCLRAMWNRGKLDGLVVDNPFAGNGVKWEPRASRIFSPEEIDAMIETAPDDWWRVFIRVLATSGLRLNEALHLRWCDVDLDAGTVTVRRHDAGRFTMDGRSYPILPWSAKAKASYRTIPLPAATVAELAVSRPRLASRPTCSSAWNDSRGSTRGSGRER